MTRSNKIALIVIAAGLTTMIVLWASTAFILKRSGVCALTGLFDNKFGDQHLKTTIAHLELYKLRHGRYPDRLSELDFTGDWDQIAFHSMAYYPNEGRDRYYLEVTRGWLCEPKLSYPAQFWAGTGYDPRLKP